MLMWYENISKDFVNEGEFKKTVLNLDALKMAKVHIASFLNGYNSYL
jgi:hypothetical protein